MTDRFISHRIFRTSYDQPLFVKNDKIYYGKPDKSAPNGWVQVARSNIQLELFLQDDNVPTPAFVFTDNDGSTKSPIPSLSFSPPPEDWDEQPIPNKKKKYIRHTKNPSRDNRKRSRLPKRVKYHKYLTNSLFQNDDEDEDDVVQEFLYHVDWENYLMKQEGTPFLCWIIY